MSRFKRLNFLSADFYVDFLNDAQERIKYFYNTVWDHTLDQLTDRSQPVQLGFCMSGRVSKENTGSGLSYEDVKFIEVPDQPGYYTVKVMVWRSTEDNFCSNPFLEENEKKWDTSQAELIGRMIGEWAESEHVFSDTTFMPQFNEIVLVKENPITGGLTWTSTTGISPTTMTAINGEPSSTQTAFNGNTQLMGVQCPPGQSDAYTYPGSVQVCQKYKYNTWGRVSEGKRGPEAIDGIVVHYDVGQSAQGTAKYLATTKKGYHFIIERDGTVLQLADPNIAIGHVSTAKMAKHGGDDTMSNNRTIGVCLSNLGYAVYKDGKFKYGASEENTVKASAKLSAKDADGDGVPDIEGAARAGREKYWEIYPPAQIQAFHKLIATLKTKYGIKNERILGHSEVQHNKVDPGPAFYLAGGWSRTRS